MSIDGKHPHFDDHRAIHWHLRLVDALAAARDAGKRVLVVYGGRGCSGTRALVERTLWKDEIAEFINGHFACLASESGVEDGDLAPLVAGLPKREPTPLCIYVAIDGRVVHSTAGARPAAVLLTDMLEALNRK